MLRCMRMVWSVSVCCAAVVVGSVFVVAVVVVVVAIVVEVVEVVVAVVVKVVVVVVGGMRLPPPMVLPSRTLAKGSGLGSGLGSDSCCGCCGELAVVCEACGGWLPLRGRSSSRGWRPGFGSALVWPRLGS